MLFSGFTLPSSLSSSELSSKSPERGRGFSCKYKTQGQFYIYYCEPIEKKLTSFFDRAKICLKSGISSSELSSIASGDGAGRRATLAVDVDGTNNTGFFSFVERERSFSERENARSSSGVGSKELERKIAFGLMSFILLHVEPDRVSHVSSSSSDQLGIRGREREGGWWLVDVHGRKPLAAASSNSFSARMFCLSSPKPKIPSWAIADWLISSKQSVAC